MADTEQVFIIQLYLTLINAGIRNRKRNEKPGTKTNGERRQKRKMQKSGNACRRMMNSCVKVGTLLKHSAALIHTLGKKPGRRNPAKDAPKPTETMKAREGSLEIDKNLGKTMVVSNPTGRGAGQPGFYCEVCNRNHKDSNSYLDHLNSRNRGYLTNHTHYCVLSSPQI
jgi:hypothetical protein